MYLWSNENVHTNAECIIFTFSYKTWYIWVVYMHDNVVGTYQIHWTYINWDHCIPKQSKQDVATVTCMLPFIRDIKWGNQCAFDQLHELTHWQLNRYLCAVDENMNTIWQLKTFFSKFTWLIRVWGDICTYTYTGHLLPYQSAAKVRPMLALDNYLFIPTHFLQLIT